MTTSKNKFIPVNTGAEITAEELNILNQTLDEFAAEISEDYSSFLGTEGQRKGIVHRSWHDLGKAMRQPRICMYPGCVEHSIPRSHTIQKAGPLSFIAEGSHVVTPSFAKGSKSYSIVRIGLNDASTFPGFCQRHEALFHEFETTGGIKTERGIILQVFRTICREIAVKKIQLAHIVKFRQSVESLVSNKGIEILKCCLGTKFVEKHGGIRSLTFKGLSKAQMTMLECEKELEEVLKGLETEFLPASAMEVDGCGALCHVSLTVQQPLPVCLSGVANFWIDDNGKHFSVRTILNVLPSQQQTLIVASTLAVHESYLHTYMQQMLDQMNGALIMVETWMVRGTDHWFMTPSEWCGIPERRQAKILMDMLDESLSIGSAYPTSVLDSVREQHLRLPECKAEPQHIFDVEASKLADRVIGMLSST